MIFYDISNNVKKQERIKIMKEKIYKPKDFAKLVNRKVWTL